MLRVLVSILTYNGGYKTLKTITDVLAQQTSGIELDVLVIDNCSSNNVLSLIKEAHPSVHVISTQCNLGFSGANNLAIDLALKTDANFLFVLNDDLQLMPNYIQEMVDGGVQRDDAAVLGSTIRLPSGKIQATCGTLKPWVAGVIWHNLKINDNNIGAREVDVVQGAAFVLTKAALQMGFRFDDCLFFGGEEYDLACWARRNLLKIYVLEHVEVVHNTSQAHLISDRWYPDPINCYYAIRNCLYIKQKYPESKLEYLIAIGYSSTRVISKGIIFAIKGNASTLKFMIKGIYDGITKRMGQYSYLDRHVS